MNKHNSVVDKVMKQMASKMIRADFDKWPPDCGLLTYQPKRPASPPKEKREKP